jgi:O-methyltransferase involved in polyketide biosynthesis
LSPSLEHSKISFTAKLVAYFRQFSDIPFAKEVAQYIGADQTFESLFPEHGVRRDELMEYAPILEARYKSIVSLISQSGIRQVIELASGFSLRGLAMTRDPSITYIDTDLESLDTEKERLISELRLQYSIENLGNYHIATANALDLAELKAAIRPFRRDQPIVIVNEGLIIYFSPTERVTLAKNILRSAAEIWRCMDYTRLP